MADAAVEDDDDLHAFPLREGTLEKALPCLYAQQSIRPSASAQRAWGILMRSSTVCAGLALLTACAGPNEMGVRDFAAQRYESAYKRWVPAAAAGDAAANYNLGLLWQQGLAVETPRNAERAGEFFNRAASLGFILAMAPASDYQLSHGNGDTALTFLNLGARWNDQVSIDRLRSYGAPVPEPDLAIAQQQARLAVANAVGQIMGCAIAGGCGTPPAPVAQSSNVNPTPRRPRDVECRASLLRDAMGNLTYHCR